MEGSTLSDQNDIKVKGQGHLTVFVLLNIISLMLQVVYRNFLIDIVGLNKTFQNIALQPLS